jgi:hypothetical protein
MQRNRDQAIGLDQHGFGRLMSGQSVSQKFRQRPAVTEFDSMDQRAQWIAENPQPRNAINRTDSLPMTVRTRIGRVGQWISAEFASRCARQPIEIGVALGAQRRFNARRAAQITDRRIAEIDQMADDGLRPHFEAIYHFPGQSKRQNPKSEARKK